MESVYRVVIPSAWIAASEFVRNELLFKTLWIEHYQSIGLTFTTTKTHSLLWILWSLALTLLIGVLVKKYNFWETVGIAWAFAFPLMWIVLQNLSVLPLKLLIYAIPFSFLEIVVATYILSSYAHKGDRHFGE